MLLNELGLYSSPIFSFSFPWLYKEQQVSSSFTLGLLVGLSRDLRPAWSQKRSPTQATIQPRQKFLQLH
jgi:hypothetical protein